MSPTVKKIKAKINSGDLIKLKSMCTAKEINHQQNEKAINLMGKIFEKYMTGNILTSKIHK